MKKFFAIILAIVLCLALCACDGGDSDTNSVEDKVRFQVESRITAYVYALTKSAPIITSYVDEIRENTFEVTGKVTVRDKYGDTYTGKYDAVVEYDPATDTCDIDYEVDTLYRT